MSNKILALVPKVLGKFCPTYYSLSVFQHPYPTTWVKPQLKCNFSVKLIKFMLLISKLVEKIVHKPVNKLITSLEIIV